jgi:hypothetical protein
MRANLRQKRTGSTGPAGAWLWLVTALLCTAVIASCTNQKDTKGPTFPAGQAGGTDGGVNVVLASRQLQPDGETFIITALVLSRTSGRPIPGVTVVLVAGAAVAAGGGGGGGAGAAELNPASGSTDESGRFTSTLRCSVAGAVTVAALVEGVGGAAPPTLTVTCP